VKTISFRSVQTPALQGAELVGILETGVVLVRSRSNQKLRLFNPREPEAVLFMPASRGACAVSPGGAFIAVLQSKKCTVYDAKTLTAMHALRGDFAFGEYGPSEDSVEFAADGSGVIISRAQFDERTDRAGRSWDGTRLEQAALEPPTPRRTAKRMQGDDGGLVRISSAGEPSWELPISASAATFRTDQNFLFCVGHKGLHIYDVAARKLYAHVEIKWIGTVAAGLDGSLYFLLPLTGELYWSESALPPATSTSRADEKIHAALDATTKQPKRKGSGVGKKLPVRTNRLGSSERANVERLLNAMLANTLMHPEAAQAIAAAALKDRIVYDALTNWDELSDHKDVEEFALEMESLVPFDGPFLKRRKAT
jgi:hypothetical protein